MAKSCWETEEDRTIDDSPDGLSETPFVDGEPDSETKDDLEPLF